MPAGGQGPARAKDVRAFPVDSLTRFTREGARRHRAWARRLGAASDRAQRALQARLGIDVRVSFGCIDALAPAFAARAASTLPPVVGLAPAGGRPLVGIEVDAACAHVLCVDTDTALAAVLDALALPLVPCGPTRLGSLLGSRPVGVLPIELARDGERAVVRVWLPDDALDAIPERASERPFADLTLPVSFQSGHTRLRVHELRRLARGDVVLVDEHHDARWVARLPRGARTELVCVVADGVLRVERMRPRESSPFPRGEIMDPKEEPLVDLDDAEIDVALEVARLQLPLHELMSLVPGDVLATNVQLGAAVVLRAGDRPVARGELVSVDGQLGVRIVELARAPR